MAVRALRHARAVSGPPLPPTSFISLSPTSTDRRRIVEPRFPKRASTTSRRALVNMASSRRSWSARLASGTNSSPARVAFARPAWMSTAAGSIVVNRPGNVPDRAAVRANDDASWITLSVNRAPAVWPPVVSVWTRHWSMTLANIPRMNGANPIRASGSRTPCRRPRPRLVVEARRRSSSASTRPLPSVDTIARKQPAPRHRA